MTNPRACIVHHGRTPASYIRTCQSSQPQDHTTDSASTTSVKLKPHDQDRPAQPLLSATAVLPTSVALPACVHTNRQCVQQCVALPKHSAHPSGYGSLAHLTLTDGPFTASATFADSGVVLPLLVKWGQRRVCIGLKGCACERVLLLDCSLVFLFAICRWLRW